MAYLKRLEDGNNYLMIKILPCSKSSTRFFSLDGERCDIGTSQGLFLYYGGAFYDITPLDTALSGTGTFTTSAAAGATVTINFTSHGLEVGRYITLTSVSMGANTTLGASDFNTYPFEVLSTTTNSFTISLTNPATV